jgi:hypothetical protein
MLAGLIFALPTANAAAKKEERVQKARVECMAGDYQAGVRILAEIYAETRDANLIYNQARCFEQNGRNEQAVLRFEEYLRVNQDLAPAEVAQIRARIVALQDPSKDRPTPAQPEPASGLSPTAAFAPSPATTERNAMLESYAAVPSPPEAATPFYKRWWFWTGVGVVVAGGVTTALLLRPQPGAKSPACDPTAACIP